MLTDRLGVTAGGPVAVDAAGEEDAALCTVGRPDRAEELMPDDEALRVLPQPTIDPAARASVTATRGWRVGVMINGRAPVCPPPYCGELSRRQTSGETPLIRATRASSPPGSDYPRASIRKVAPPAARAQP